MIRFPTLICAAIVALLPATAALAQDVNFSPEATLTCFYESDDMDDPTQCIGLSANLCMENTPDGFSTIGMGGRFDAELTLWDGLLNEVYAEVRTYDRLIDAEKAIPAGGPRPCARCNAHGSPIAMQPAPMNTRNGAAEPGVGHPMWPVWPPRPGGKRWCC